MAGDVTTSVTAVVSVVDKATPAIESITKSIEGIGDVAKQVNTATAGSLDALLARVEAGSRSIAEINADVARSIAEQRRQLEAAGPLQIPPWAKIHAPELPTPTVPELPTPEVAPDVAAQIQDVADAVEESWQPLRAIREQIQSQFSQVLDTVQMHVGRVGEAFRERFGGAIVYVSGLFSQLGSTIRKHLGGAFDFVSGIATKLGSTVKTVFLGIGTFLAGFSIASVVAKLDAILDETIAKVSALGDRAEAIGLPVEKLQELQRWAEQSGVSAGELDKSLGRLTQTLGQVAAGRNKDAAQVFKDLGIALTDTVTGAPRQAADILRDLATKLHDMPDATERARVGLALFGQDWEGMIGALRKGPEALDAAAAMQKRIGEISGMDVESIRKYQAAQADLAATFAAIRLSIGTALVPVLTPIVENVQAWVLANREFLKQDVAAVVQGLAAALKDLGPFLKSMVDAFKEVQTVIEWVSDKLPKLRAPEPLQVTLDVPASFELPDPTKDWDPITKIREGIIQALKDMGDASNLWKGTLLEIQTIWEAIAKAIGFVAEKWAAFKGGLTGAPWDVTALPTPPRVAWEQPTAPPPGIAAPPPEGTPGAAAGGLVGAAMGGQPANGKVEVLIENKNPPPGTRTTAKATGPGVTTDVGQSMPWTAPAYGAGPWAPAGA
jgi:hypothetical protein